MQEDYDVRTKSFFFHFLSMKCQVEGFLKDNNGFSRISFVAAKREKISVGEWKKRRLLGSFVIDSSSSSYGLRARNWHSTNEGSRSSWEQTVALPRLIECVLLMRKIDLQFSPLSTRSQGGKCTRMLVKIGGKSAVSITYRLCGFYDQSIRAH